MNIDKDSLQSLALQNLTVEDIAHKIFLKPLEITLRTSKNDSGVAVGDLPRGIRIALKESIFDNAFQSVAFNPFQPTSPLSQNQVNNSDNMISYLKSQGDLQVAICICMYSENRRMLKDTLKGVEDNIAAMIKSGVNPDSIGVFVIVDGIQKLDQSVITGYEEFQRESGVNIQRKNDRDLLDEVEQEQRMNKENNFSLEEFVQKHMSNLVFNTIELEDRQERRLPNVCQQYKNFKKTRQVLLQLRESKDTNNLYEQLPQKIREDFFLKQARQQKLRQMQERGEKPTEQIKKQALIEQFAYNPVKSKKVGIAAINKAISYIDKFLSTRDQLSYLASFRKRIYLPPKQTEKGEFIQEQFTNGIMNLFFCIKYRNAGKLSSHNWFFNGFCKELNPKHVILLDVGLKPSGQSIFNMYQHLKENPNVGGVCGYMQLRLQKMDDDEQIKEEQIDWLSSLSLVLFDIQKAQQIQYHLAHMIDKPFQSAFNFIHVLPGAFSGYSMSALKSTDNEDKLLKEYFRSIEEKLMETTIKRTNITVAMVLLRVFLPQFLYNLFYGVQPQSEQEMLYNQNIYFAEDRILCMEIHKNGKNLIFLPDACAEVDPMKTVEGLMGQRKRWMNGSYFAFQKVKKQIESCDILLRLQVIFYNFINIFVYFAPSLFFFTIHITMTSFRLEVLHEIIKNIEASPQTNNQLLNFFVYTIDLIYALLLGVIIFFSLTTPANRPIFKPYIYFVSSVLGWFAISVFILYLVDVIRGLSNGTLFLLQGNDQLQSDSFKILLEINRWFVVGVFGLYVFPVLVYCILFCTLKPIVQATKAALSFLFYNPTYFIILTFYSLCRIDDISWGTKGLNSQNSQQSAIKQKWKMIKLIHVCKYLLWNVVASVLLLSFAQVNKPKFFISFVIVISIILTVGLKIFIGSIYMLKYKCQSACRSISKKNNENNEVSQSKFDETANKFKQEVEKSIKQRIGDMTFEQIRRNGNNMRTASYISVLRKLQLNKPINQKDFQQHSKIHQQRSDIHRRARVRP